MEPVTGEIDVTWTLEGDYNDSPSAENTFRWSFDVSKLEDYEIAVGCETTGIAVIKIKRLHLSVLREQIQDLSMMSRILMCHNTL